MSELSIVLDLRLLGKMWHGTREEQTPQPVRMTLGNKGAIHLPSPCFQWSFRLAFTVVLWCIHGLSLEIQPTWNQCCFHSWFCSFFLVIAVLLSYMALRSLPVWMGLSIVSSEVGKKWMKFCWMSVVLKQNGKVHSVSVYVFSWHLVGWHGCSYVTQLCVVLNVANGSSAFSICSPLTWVASKFLIATTGCLW